MDKKRDYDFEVVIPSLPGYRFSDGAVRPGLGLAQVSLPSKIFMEQLCFGKYYLQGGDWNGMIVHAMAALFPEKGLGVYSNMCFVSTLLSNVLEKLLSAAYR